MTRITPDPATGLRSLAALALALGVGACGLKGATGEDTTGGSAPRCETCVGEDGGAPAPPAVNGQTVALLETTAADPVFDFVLRGTVPVPPHTYPRGDGRDPFVLLDWDGTPVPTQTEIVSRYPSDADGADVVEVLGRVHRDPAVPSGAQMRYEVVAAPTNALAGPGTVDLGDLLATSSVPAAIQNLLADPNGIEIATYDCFGHKYVCRPLDGSGTYRLMRRGRVSTELRVYQTMVPESFVPGASGTLPHFFGVHAYLTTLTGQGVLGLVLRFNNGSSGRNAGSPLDDPLDKVYFQKVEVRLPQNLSFMQDFDDPFLGGFTAEGSRWVWNLVEPAGGGKLHVMRWQGQFHRRLWITTSAEVPLGRSYANGIGQGFCVRGTDPFFGAEYWSWWNKGTARYFNQKYQLPRLDHLDLAGLRGQLEGERAHLAQRLQNGTEDGDYPIDSPVLGWGHPYGVSYGGMTSGNEIFLYDGVGVAASAATSGYQQYTALHRMQTDRQPTALYDLDGEPTSVERWLVENGSRDYVPFYCYQTPFLTGSYPDPFGYHQAPRFQVEYVAAHGLAPSYEGQHLAFDPHDFQHLIRYTRSAKVLAWLGNDSLAKDDLRLEAELFHLSYHDNRNDVNGGFQSGGLLGQRAVVDSHPGKGSPFGRGEAWGVDCALAAFNTSDPAWRASKRAWFGKIVEMLSEGQGTCTGFLQAFVSSKAVNGLYRARQQIEQSITENVLQSLRESAFRGVDPGHAAMSRDVLVNSLYAFIGEMAWFPGEHAPWRYTGIGPLDVNLPIWCRRGQMPPGSWTAGDTDGFQDWSSFAWGFEITGDPIFLDRALTQIGGGNLMNRLRSDGTTNLENRSALLALMQHEGGQL